MEANFMTIGETCFSTWMWCCKEKSMWCCDDKVTCCKDEEPDCCKEGLNETCIRDCASTEQLYQESSRVKYAGVQVYAGNFSNRLVTSYKERLQVNMLRTAAGRGHSAAKEALKKYDESQTKAEADLKTDNKYARAACFDNIEKENERKRQAENDEYNLLANNPDLALQKKMHDEQMEAMQKQTEVAQAALDAANRL